MVADPLSLREDSVAIIMEQITQLPRWLINPFKRAGISRSSDKRQKQLSKYPSKRKAFIEAQRDQEPKGYIFCIFCGTVIYGEPSLHHGMGRDDESLLDETAWFLSHNDCHVHEYHSMSCKDIEWWDNYMFRIKSIHREVYKKDHKTR